MSSPPTKIYVDAIAEWQKKTEEFYRAAMNAGSRIFGPKASVYEMAVQLGIANAIDEVVRIASLKNSAISFPGPLMATRIPRIDDFTVTLGPDFTITEIGPHGVMFSAREESGAFGSPHVFLSNTGADHWRVIGSGEFLSGVPIEEVYASGAFRGRRTYPIFMGVYDGGRGLARIIPSMGRVDFWEYYLDLPPIRGVSVGIVDGSTAAATVFSDGSFMVEFDGLETEMEDVPENATIGEGPKGTKWEIVVKVQLTGQTPPIFAFYAMDKETGGTRIEFPTPGRVIVENGLFAFGEGKLTCLRTDAEVPYEGDREHDTGYRGIFYRSTEGVFFWDVDWSEPRRLAGPEFTIIDGTRECFDGADSRVLVSGTRNLIAFRDTVLPIDLPNGKILYTIQLGVGQLVVVMENNRLYYAERHGQVVVTWYVGLGNDAVLINDRRLLVAGILYDEDEPRPIEIVRVYDVGASSARSFANTLEQLAAEALADREGKAKLLGDLSIPLSVKGTIAGATLGD